MAITTLSRYGAQEVVGQPSRYEAKVRALVDELCEEQFARPDYEHCEVSVRHPSGWFIAATMPGLVTLGHLDGGARGYLYGLPRSDLVRLMVRLARGKLDEVRGLPWADSAGAVRGRGDHYLLASRPDLTALHRAAAKGDRGQAEAELAAGADVAARDKHGATPLHWAALAGHPEVCRFLLTAGADPAARDRDGATPVEYAEMSNEYIGPAGAEKLVRALQRKRPGA